jgi:hypothetical protein
MSLSSQPPSVPPMVASVTASGIEAAEATLSNMASGTGLSPATTTPQWPDPAGTLPATTVLAPQYSPSDAHLPAKLSTLSTTAGIDLSALMTTNLMADEASPFVAPTVDTPNARSIAPRLDTVAPVSTQTHGFVGMLPVDVRSSIKTLMPTDGPSMKVVTAASFSESVNVGEEAMFENGIADETKSVRDGDPFVSEVVEDAGTIEVVEASGTIASWPLLPESDVVPQVSLSLVPEDNFATGEAAGAAHVPTLRSLTRTADREPFLAASGDETMPRAVPLDDPLHNGQVANESSPKDS